MRMTIFSSAAALAVLVAGAQSATAVLVVQENFTYADGDVDNYNGGMGWAAAWENGNSNATRRFRVVNSEVIYNGGGNGTETEQNRGFASAITVGLLDTVTLTFNLIRPESQVGRGIGIYLTNAGANEFFLGKEINDVVGLKSGMVMGSNDYAEFASSGTTETITTIIIYDGTDTSFVLSDSNETLPAYKQSGQFTFDGISLAGYHASTTTNGIDSISIDVTSVPEPSVFLFGSIVAAGFIIVRLRR